MHVFDDVVVWNIIAPALTAWLVIWCGHVFEMLGSFGVTRIELGGRGNLMCRVEMCGKGSGDRGWVVEMDVEEKLLVRLGEAFAKLALNGAV